MAQNQFESFVDTKFSIFNTPQSKLSPKSTPNLPLVYKPDIQGDDDSDFDHINLSSDLDEIENFAAQPAVQCCKPPPNEAVEIES